MLFLLLLFYSFRGLLPLLQHRTLLWKQSFINLSSLSPLHGLQLFTNCSSGSPSHWVQSFRNNAGPPRGSQVQPPNLLQSGFLSPQGHRLCQEPAPAQLSPRMLMGLALARDRSILGSLALALPDMAEASGSFQQKPPLQPPYPPHCPNLATQTPYRPNRHPTTPNDIYPSPDNQGLLLMCNGNQTEEEVIYFIMSEPVINLWTKGYINKYMLKCLCFKNAIWLTELMGKASFVM